MPHSVLATDPAVAVPPCPPSSSPTSAVPAGPDPTALFAAGERLAALLGQGHTIDARILRAAMEESLGGSDATGAWSWKDAYDSCEAAQVLVLQRFGAGLQAQPPAARLKILTRLSAMLPTHNHLAALRLPAGLRHLYLAQDADPAGLRAVERLAGRAEAGGVDVRPLVPVRGDVNDDLLADGVEVLRGRLLTRFAVTDAARLAAFEAV